MCSSRSANVNNFPFGVMRVVGGCKVKKEVPMNVDDIKSVLVVNNKG